LAPKHWGQKPSCGRVKRREQRSLRAGFRAYMDVFDVCGYPDVVSPPRSRAKARAAELQEGLKPLQESFDTQMQLGS